MPQQRWLPYALIAPAVLFLLALFVAPLVQTILLSFQDGNSLGLANYRRMASDLNFAPALRNTFLLVVVIIPVQLALALAMGMMLQKMTVARDLVMWIWTI